MAYVDFSLSGVIVSLFDFLRWS